MLLINLHTLNLAASRITYIDVNVFYGLQRLRNLNLENVCWNYPITMVTTITNDIHAGCC
jgi:hypothetical protein